MRFISFLSSILRKKKANNKTDWDELAEECQAFVKEKGLTEKDLYEFLNSLENE